MKVTTRAALATWLDALAERYTVIAPRWVEKELLFRPVTSSADIVFQFERTILSPKTFLFPDTEVILEVEKRGGETALPDLAPIHEQVIFGVRPCDARGLMALDALLLERSPPDTHYAERRETTALIGLACPRLWEDCFCTSLGSTPDDTSSVDVMLYAQEPSQGEEDGGYLVQGVTDKGESLLDGLKVDEADRTVPASDVSGEEVPVLPPERWRSLFDDRYWQRLAERCLSCHACTYVCPTCRCFDVRDDTAAAGPGYTRIQRLRAWDSCLAPGYRRLAGGHNPRPTKDQRLRNRFYCKFCYSPLDFGAVACVGCGRCIAVCPVGIDIAEMLRDVMRLEKDI
jgi:sulfhydrogenase subunit beta (sulfur reductase)